MLELPVDDDVFSVDSWYLIGDVFRFRYVAAPLFAGISTIVLAVLHRLPIHSFVAIVTLWLVIASALTWGVMKQVSYDKPFRTVVAMFWHEVCSPRAPRRQESVVTMTKVKVNVRW